MTPGDLVDQVPLALWLLIDALAVYRLTRLVTRDSLWIVARPREAVAERWAGRALGYFVECPWCVSAWIAPLVIAARLWTPVPWSLLALVLAYSAVAGYASEHE